ALGHKRHRRRKRWCLQPSAFSVLFVPSAAQKWAVASVTPSPRCGGQSCELIIYVLWGLRVANFCGMKGGGGDAEIGRRRAEAEGRNDGGSGLPTEHTEYTEGDRCVVLERSA